MSIREEEDTLRPEPEDPEDPGPASKKWMAILGGLVCVFVVLAGYDLASSWTALSGGSGASATGSPAGVRPTAAAMSRAAASAASPAPSLSPASVAASATATGSPSASREPAHALSVVSVAAFGPEGTSDGDNAGIVSRVIDGGGAQAWYSAWYTTPEFGNLQSGTGILLDMGETVTVSRVRLVLGDSVGADVAVRVGDVAALADLSAAASASDVGGVVDLRVKSPASGRYVLVWFTRLPPNSQGKYQVGVYSVTVDGVAGHAR